VDLPEAARMDPSEISLALRSGIVVPDAAIDAYLPPSLRALASRFWTPVEVASQAAWWFWSLGARRVLDLGSGAGKFCVTAALARELDVTGVEQRAGLVESARELAVALGAWDRVQFIHGQLESVDPSGFDAIYAFNPFEENLFVECDRIDSTVDLSPGKCVADIEYVERVLAQCRPGTLFATYHGFGGRIPMTFELAREADVGTNVLRLWRKTDREPTGAAWVEVGIRTVQLASPTVDPRKLS
jgi:SAM-dependent methyltransferase